MPRVKSSDRLYKPITDKVLPQLPQSEANIEDVPKTPITPTIRKVSNDTIQEEAAAKTIKTIPPIPEETIPYTESAWQDYHTCDAKLIRCNLLINLQTAIDQIKADLNFISVSNARYNCLISLLGSIAETTKPYQSLHQRAVDQRHSLAEKESQLLNASNFVLEHNNVLIKKCRILFSDTTESSHELQVACGEALAHAKESSIAQQDKRIPKPLDFGKGLEILVAFNKDISTVIENVASINGLLASHKQNVDIKVAHLNTEVIKLASRRDSGILRRMMCFK